MKSVRLGVFGALLMLCSLVLTACGGGDTSDIALYPGATALEPDATTLTTFKDAMKPVKEAKLEMFAIKDDPAAIRAHYEAQYADKGWKKEPVTDAAKQQEAVGSWALAYEKSGKLSTLTLVPAAQASARFPNAGGSNVLLKISGAR
jgi:hypothetical protein